jgi:hypothetical protein
MSKVKMRCTTCDKWFQSANAKEVTCPECTQKAKKNKQAAKDGPQNANHAGETKKSATATTVRPAPKPKPTHSGTNQWLDSLSDVKIGQPEQPARPKSVFTRESRDGDRGPVTPREGRERTEQHEDDQRPAASTAVHPEQRPRQPMERNANRGPRPERIYPAGAREGAHAGPRPKPKGKVFKPKAPPRPKREKTPPPEPFTPTPEQVTQVEERYLELAAPGEFDGIRTQIANELSIPKKAVKKIVKELRERQHIPSWWESQTYKGSAEELEKIKEHYLPLLPLPLIGAHKRIADQLEMKAGNVYQAIKVIRLEMNLPQYNDPALHAGEQKPAQPEKQQDVTPPTEGEGEQAEAPATIAENAQQGTD